MGQKFPLAWPLAAIAQRRRIGRKLLTHRLYLVRAPTLCTAEEKEHIAISVLGFGRAGPNL